MSQKASSSEEHGTVSLGGNSVRQASELVTARVRVLLANGRPAQGAKADHSPTTQHGWLCLLVYLSRQLLDSSTKRVRVRVPSAQACHSPHEPT
jgi:hypothetical protein